MRRYNQLFIAVASVSMILGVTLLSQVSCADETNPGHERSGQSNQRGGEHRERADNGAMRTGRMPAGGGVANPQPNRPQWTGNAQTAFNHPIATPVQSNPGRDGWQHGSGNHAQQGQMPTPQATPNTAPSFNHGSNPNRPNESFQGVDRRTNDRSGWNSSRGDSRWNGDNHQRVWAGNGGLNHGWTNHYRMPYWQGDSGRYRVHYYRSWPSDYGWRDHGWRVNYEVVDPYWYAIATSMAYSQAWSDAELAQAINDDNLRQQLIYDADVRQQMQASGYPADQMDYPPDEAEQPPYTPEYAQAYPASPEQPNPNSPLYQGPVDSNSTASITTGEQVANRNANQNFLFLCNAGNRVEAAEALKQVQSPDLSVWKDMQQFNTCSSWATAP